MCVGGLTPHAEKQSVFSTAPADWAKVNVKEGQVVCAVHRLTIWMIVGQLDMKKDIVGKIISEDLGTTEI